MRSAMVVYLVGLVLVTSAIELTLALALAVRGALPPPSSTFLLLYAVVDLALFAAGGAAVLRGLQALRSKPPPVSLEAPAPDDPPE